MRLYVIDGKSRIPLDIQHNHLVGRGGAALVVRINDNRFPNRVAKIFHSPDQCDRAKLEHMLAYPPTDLWLDVRGQRVPFVTWPLQLLENDRMQAVGYLMPYVDLKHAYLLQVYIELMGDLDEQDQSISLRVPVARNLAAALASMHARGDYFIDLKSQNIYVVKNSGNVILIDADGCAIGSGRFPAKQYSQQYRAPEVLINHATPESLSINDFHDRFTLAVLIFQILNIGIHPFSGIQRDKSIEAGETDEKVKRGWYAYGLTANPEIAPSPHSLHEYWDIETRRLFDRALTAKRPSERPPAAEWVAHFDRLLANKFSRCDRYPNEIRHIHFKGKPCFVCGKLTANKPAVAPVQPHSPLLHPSPQPLPPSPPPVPWWREWLRLLGNGIKLVFGLIVALLILAAFVN